MKPKAVLGGVAVFILIMLSFNILPVHAELGVIDGVFATPSGVFVWYKVFNHYPGSVFNLECQIFAFYDPYGEGQVSQFYGDSWTSPSLQYGTNFAFCPFSPAPALDFYYQVVLRMYFNGDFILVRSYLVQVQFQG